jgi:hypothetical protein
MLRYVAASTILVAITLHAFDMYPYGVYVHILGAMLWSYMAVKTKDHAVFLNFFPQIFILGAGIINYLALQ